MGKFFNEKIMNMPSATLRKLKRSVLVKENPVYGQTKGFLEEMRRDFNSAEEVSDERQKVLDRMAKARAARKKNG